MGPCQHRHLGIRMEGLVLLQGAGVGREPAVSWWQAQPQLSVPQSLGSWTLRLNLPIQSSFLRTQHTAWIRSPVASLTGLPLVESSHGHSQEAVLWKKGGLYPVGAGGCALRLSLITVPILLASLLRRHEEGLKAQ